MTAKQERNNFHSSSISLPIKLYPISDTNDQGKPWVMHGWNDVQKSCAYTLVIYRPLLTGKP